MLKHCHSSTKNKSFHSKGFHQHNLTYRIWFLEFGGWIFVLLWRL